MDKERNMRVPASMVFLGGIALLCLAAGTGLVIVSSKSRHALVREDYYRDGLRLDAYRAREAAFDSLGLSLSLRSEGGALLVEGVEGVEAAEAGKNAEPENGVGGSFGGKPAVRERLGRLSLTLQLRRPDDPALDRDVLTTLASDAPFLWAADADPLRRGRWNVRAVFADSTGKPVLENAFTYDAP